MGIMGRDETKRDETKRDETRRDRGGEERRREEKRREEKRREEKKDRTQKRARWTAAVPRDVNRSLGGAWFPLQFTFPLRSEVKSSQV